MSDKRIESSPDLVCKHIKITRKQLDYINNKSEALNMSASCLVRLAIDKYIVFLETGKD